MTEAKLKRKIVTLCLSALCCALVMEAKTAPKPTNFSGHWELNTSQTKNLPDGLESYSMVVTQDAQQMKVQTTLKGDLRSPAGLNQPYPGGNQQPENRAGYPGGMPGGYPGRMGGGIGMGRMGGMGLPGGGAGPMGEGVPTGGGMPGGGARPHTARQQLGRAAAFTIYPQTAVYKLDGSESTAQLGGPMNTDATSKAAWAKGGKELKLSLEGTGNSGWRGGGLDLGDQWKLSKDGRQLLVDRKVHSPSGSASIHLVFQKAAPEASH